LASGNATGGRSVILLHVGSFGTENARGNWRSGFFPAAAARTDKVRGKSASDFTPKAPVFITEPTSKVSPVPGNLGSPDEISQEIAVDIVSQLQEHLIPAPRPKKKTPGWINASQAFQIV
jgi:hypothetical protein